MRSSRAGPGTVLLPARAPGVGLSNHGGVSPCTIFLGTFQRGRGSDCQHVYAFLSARGSVFFFPHPNEDLVKTWTSNGALRGA